MKTIFDFKEVKNEVSSINGLKNLIIVGLVSGHGILFRFLNADVSSSSYKSYVESQFHMHVLAILGMVDMFFIFTAVITTRTALSDLKK